MEKEHNQNKKHKHTHKRKHKHKHKHQAAVSKRVAEARVLKTERAKPWQKFSNQWNGFRLKKNQIEAWEGAKKEAKRTKGEKKDEEKEGTLKWKGHGIRKRERVKWA